jgi:hypothetical protein
MSRVQVLTAVTVNTIIFTDMTPRGLVDMYHRSVLTGYLYCGGSIFYRNTDSYEMIHLIIGEWKLYKYHRENCKSHVFCELFDLILGTYEIRIQRGPQRFDFANIYQ